MGKLGFPSIFRSEKKYQEFPSNFDFFSNKTKYNNSLVIFEKIGSMELLYFVLFEKNQNYYITYTCLARFDVG